MSKSVADKNIKLLCPICGCENFILPDEKIFNELDDTSIVQCALCKKQFTKAAILEVNQERIDVEIKAMADEAISQAMNELRAAFRKLK